MLEHELRPGSQHSQKDTPEFIASCVAKLDKLKLNGKALLRLDSGNDAADNFEHFGGNYFIIKRPCARNLRNNGWQMHDDRVMHKRVVRAKMFMLGLSITYALATMNPKQVASQLPMRSLNVWLTLMGMNCSCLKSR